MAGDDIPKHLKKTFPTECYPEMDDSDDEDMDPMSESFDIRMGKKKNKEIYFLLFQSSKLFI